MFDKKEHRKLGMSCLTLDDKEHKKLAISFRERQRENISKKKEKARDI